MSTSGDNEQHANGKSGSGMWQHGFRLGAFALGTVLIIALAYSGTAERIEEQRLQTARNALATLMPPLAHDNDLLNDSFQIDPASGAYRDIELLGLSTARTAYVATLRGQPNGVILPLETADGYNGAITLLVGIDADGVISGVRVLDHTETPGLGDSIDLDVSSWILGFDQRSLANTDTLLWRVKKDGGEFDQFVGATITPRAVTGAVHKGLQFFAANRGVLLNGGTGKEQP